MENFVFQNPTRIIFGRDTENQVGGELKGYKKVLLHYGRNSIKRSGLYDRVVASLKAAGVSFVELGGVKPNPTLDLVHEGIELCRKEGVDVILAVGGGSAIDSAKAIAMGVPYQGDVWDFYLGKGEPKSALPVCTILTIAAAGSESSDGTVISKADGEWKYGFGSDLLYPIFSILNPALTMTLPAYQTACGIADMSAHLFERYFTMSANTDLSDRLIEATLQTINLYGPRAVACPDDYEARAEIMWAGTLAHNGLFGMGREEDWASHQIEHELSAIYDVPHGAGLAVVFPAWMKHVYKRNIPRFSQFARRVWGIDFAEDQSEQAALAGIERQKAFFASIGLPVTLEQLGIPADRIEEMAEKAVLRGALGSFQKLSSKDVSAIYNLAR